MAIESKANLADGLLKHGIGRNVDDIVEDLFKGLKDKQLDKIEFKNRMIDELEVSHK